MFIPLYKALMTISFPLIKATYIKKRQKNNKEPVDRFPERLGLYTLPRPQGKLYWFHGASVGEAVSMLPLINKLLDEDENLSIMVTTGTLTSAEIMEKRLPKRAFHQFIPFDVPKFAKNLLNHFKPDVVLWFESELWPSLISEIHTNKIPLILVNGRISDSSFSMWKKFKPIIKEILSNFTLLLGQSWQDKNRLEILSQQKAQCFGNIKFAGLPLEVPLQKKAEILKQINNRPIFLISSTHNNEEEQLATHFHMLFQHIKNLLVIIVPRHPNRGEEVRTVIQKFGYKTACRSQNEPITDDTTVYIADTIGEMGLWYDISPISFIGGSLIPHGGQNFNEPAKSQNAVIVGPYMHNFAEMIERAHCAHAIIEVKTAYDVIEKVIELLYEPDTLLQYQQQAYAWAMNEQKVLDDITNAIKQELAS